jgi:RNA polymerase sigma-70 factor (ECF subfamily)
LTSSSQEVTQLLQRWSKGDRTALDKLVPIVHRELHRLAHHYMGKERPGHTLQTTALINEAYLRLIGAAEIDWQNRAHFLAVSARVMRHILVDRARAREDRRAGNDVVVVSLDEAPDISKKPGADLIALESALNALEELDPRKCKVVELRFFGGLSIEEIAEVLSVSAKTVLRDWQFAKLWLLHEMKKK